MKNLKYMIFTLLISFIFVTNVSAKTVYKCNDGDEHYGNGMCKRINGYTCPEGYIKSADGKQCYTEKKCNGNYNAENGKCVYRYVTNAIDINGNLYCNQTPAATTEQNDRSCVATSAEKPTCPTGTQEQSDGKCYKNATVSQTVYGAVKVEVSDSSSSSSSSTGSSSKSSSSKKKTTKKSSSSITIKCLDKGFNVDKEKQKVLPVFIKNKNNKPVSVSTGSKKIKVEMSGNYIYVTGLKKASVAYVKVKVGSKSVKCPVKVNKKDTQTVELSNAESEANKVLSDSPQTNTSGNTSATKKGSKELKQIKCNGTTTVKVGKTKKVKITTKPTNSDLSNVNVVVKTGKNKIKITSSPDPTKVKGLKKGNSQITFKYNGKITTCKVKVTKEDSKKSNKSSNSNNSNKAKSIKIEGVSKMSVGDKRTYIAYVSPSKANQNVTWKSDDKTKATINKSGQVVAKKKGTVTITATSTDNSSVKKTKKITITKKETKNNNNGLVAKAISIPSKKQISVGGKTKLKVTYDPSGSKTGVNWTTSDKKVATVDSDGTVVGHKQGNVTITAIYKSDKTIKAECQIIVTKKVTLKSINVSPKNVSLKEGEKKTVVATLSPSNVSNKKVIWESSKSSVASVNSKGQITAKKKGTATITAVSKMDSSKTASVKVKVKKNNDIVSTLIPLSVTAEPSEINIAVGQKKKIKITTGASNYKFRFSKKNIITLDSDGTVTGQKVGTTIITATHKSDSKLTARITVNVGEKKEVKKVQITAIEGSVEVGDSLKLGVDVQPSNASNKKVTWSSSDNKIATVNDSGKVTGKKVGTTKITVTSKSDTTKKSSIKITVVKKGEISNKIPLTDLRINEQDITLVSGSTQTLSLLKTPINATSKISWKSSDNKIVTVNKNGKLKGYKAGEATITAGILSGDKMIAATTKVTVVPKADGSVEELKVKGINLNKTKLTLPISKSLIGASFETYEKLKVSYKPTGATATSKLKWSSSDRKVASVDSDGTVTGHKAGSAIITVKHGKYSAKCTVTVKNESSKKIKKETKSSSKKSTKKSGWNWEFLDSKKKKKQNNKKSQAKTSNGKYIFIGDSRTVGMKSAVASNKNDIWSAKVGEGYTWMKNTGVPAVESKIGKNSKVVILMGVNDLNSNAYISYLNNKAKKWKEKGATVYFVSVNPVDETKARSNGYTITNASIESFNKAMKNGLSSNVKYINTYSKIGNFGTTDGLHYNNDTYKKIYNYIKKLNSSSSSSSSSSKKTDTVIPFTWKVFDGQEAITINQTSNASDNVLRGNVDLFCDKSYVLKSNISNVKFSSNDASIATVDENGNISTTDTGTVVITIKDSNNAILGELTLNITEEPEPDEPNNSSMQIEDPDDVNEDDSTSNSSQNEQPNNSAEDGDDDDE